MLWLSKVLQPIDPRDFNFGINILKKHPAVRSGVSF